MTMTIKNVAIASATGTLGAHVLRALQATNAFTITILTRSAASIPTNDPSLTIKEVDYTSLDSLTAALQGQHALVNASNTTDPSIPLLLIDAVAAAGISRFIPSDFGCDITNPRIACLPVFGIKAAVHARLQAVAAANPGFTWTVVSNGPFLDWCVRVGFSGIDLRRKAVNLHGKGDNVNPWTTLAGIARATAGVLLHAEETANRPVYVASVYASQAELAGLAREAVPGGWREEDAMDVEARFEECMVSVGKGVYTPEVMLPQIQYAMQRPEMTYRWARDDNELLGVERMGDEEVRQMFRGIAAGLTKA
ncbi:hypothetical protein ACHAQH_000372 [Verticillium albo-atrum]